MKKLLGILLFSVLALGAQSQELKFGPKIGLNKSNYAVYEFFGSAGEPLELLGHKKSMGFTSGLFLRAPLGKKWFVQPELLYTVDKTQIAVQDEIGREVETIRFHRLEAPLMIGRKFLFTKARFGVLLSTDLGTDQEMEQNGVFGKGLNLEEGIATSFTMGFGLDLGRMTLDFAWIRPMQKGKFSQEIAGLPLEVDFERKAFQASLAFNIAKGKKKMMFKKPTP